MEKKKEVKAAQDNLQVITNEQLIHLKLDNLALQIRQIVDALTGKKK